MRKLFFVGVLFIFASCSKSSSSSPSSTGLITMRTASGTNFSSNSISNTLTTETGKFFFSGRPFDNYNPNYSFYGTFDVRNSLILKIPLPNSTSTTTVTTITPGTELTINNIDYYLIKQVVNFTSNVYPGRIAGNYTIYDAPNYTTVLCTGTFDYTAK
jgi:hypothetical protein